MEEQPCAADTVCVYPAGNSAAQCVSKVQACGGFLGNTCGTNAYCEFFGGQCNEGATCSFASNRCAYVNGGATGVCQPLPSDSACANSGKPVCGCDGVTYKNDCARRGASVAFDHSGECTGGTGGGGAGGSSGRGGAGGAGGYASGLGGSGGTIIDAGPSGDEAADASSASEFCLGQDSKIGLNGKTWTVPVTSKPTDLALNCCTSYAAHLHSQPAVGEDLELVVRFPLGSLRAGSYLLGLSQSIGASLRSTARADAGAASEARVNGTLTVAGKPEDRQQPWQMGLCLSVEDASSRWQGLRIYVPGVPVAAASWASRFRIWPLEDSSLTATDVEHADLNTLELASSPLLSLTDLDFVQASACPLGGQCTWMGLNTQRLVGSTLLGLVRGTASAVGVHGVPFVVEADGQRIYLGTFGTMISSVGIYTPQVTVEDIADDGFAIEPPRKAEPPASDLRNDPRIVKVFSEAGMWIP
jgi:hypothetical protein